MDRSNTILRHVTASSNIPSILQEGKLNAKFTPRKISSDIRYVAFEEYTGSNVFEKLYKENRLKGAEIFPLFFCKKHMLDDGIVFHFGQGFPSKVENQVFVFDKTISENEYEQIGDYLFIENEVALRYLTDECKNSLRTYATKNGIRFNDNIFQ